MTLPRVQRRLAAILAADVVGYSRLMQADEAGTLAVLKARWRDVLVPGVARHRGRVVKVMGDGVLVEFGSAVDAVQCAVDLLQGFDAANEGAAEDRRIVLRIGINLGEVIVEGSDIYGDGVNIAARLEGIAEPGGLCVSAKVFAEVQGKVEVAFVDAGEQVLKNIAVPLRVYKSAAAGAASAIIPVPAAVNKPSIAVLAFQNMSGDPEQEYFADGVVEDIITALSRMHGLFVIARNSSFIYKGRAVDVKQIGRELGVRYVLEGSIRKAGGRVRLTAQLIDAATGAHLWAERYDGALEDVFDLQDQIASRVVGSIAPRLEQAEIERIARKPIGNLDAYDHYLRGMAAFHRFTQDANRVALSEFGHAFALDPDYAAAWGMAARTYGQRQGFGWLTDRVAEGAEAVRLAREAVLRGPDDAIALAAAGFALVLFGELADGDAYLDRALELNPNFAWALHISGVAKARRGRSNAAEERALRAMRLSPQDPQTFAFEAAIAMGQYLAGRYGEAFMSAQKAMRTKPNFLISVIFAAASAALSGRPAEAAAAMVRLREFFPDIRLSTLSDHLGFERPADLDHCAKGLREAGLPD